MLINKYIAIHTNKVYLVPYCKHHVLRYHEWMKDPDIQVATASEPLTLEAEYAMQQSWRTDNDKLTFITCYPHEPTKASFDEEISNAIGDVNLFVQTNEEESGNLSLVGEIELMIAEKQNQRKGLGRVVVLVFLKYILMHQQDILREHFAVAGDTSIMDKLAYLRVKIGETNSRSIHLFESVGFEKTEVSPNFFGEFELRAKSLTLEGVERMMEEREVKDYDEVSYPDADLDGSGA